MKNELRKLLLLPLFMFFIGVNMVMAQAFDLGIEGKQVTEYFATLTGMVLLVPIAVQFIKRGINKLGIKPKDSFSQVITWAVSILVVFISAIFNIGLFADVVIATDWYVLLIYGFGVGLASNGWFDIGLIKMILKRLVPVTTQ